MFIVTEYAALNKSNAFDTEAPVLDTDKSNGDDFNFEIVIFILLDECVPRSPSYGV